ncbi:hypothetical protein TRFO_09457 [Tritrichomonas foetus]|uniref:DUF3447 domain-containing protein n=1 Tax=Tritrichomonas foetus TaxID=1144522 RepID=A0A1J4JE67_9EUKA|nr:hypothetical protein TRFO_09457 [Tritrichomonas foetus]|eukprot:OHS97450.1 hypothetical protein TRFO_09457 [Tritrichomonas foetus]
MARTKSTPRRSFHMQYRSPGKNKGAPMFSILQFSVNSTKEKPNSHLSFISMNLNLMSQNGFYISNIIEYILENAPKDFKIIVDGNEYFVNKIILQISSEVIKTKIKNDPKLSFYEIQTPASSNFISKFVNILNGKIVKIEKSEFRISRKIAKELALDGFPPFMKPKDRNSPTMQNVYQSNAKYINLGISKQSFLLYLSECEKDIVIKTRNNSYKVPYLGAICSPVIMEFIKSDNELTEYFYDLEDDNKEFEILSKFMTGQVYDLTPKNLEISLRMSEDLAITPLFNYIKDSIEDFQKRNENIKKFEYIMNDVNELLDKLLHLNKNNFEETLSYLTSSIWCQDSEHVKEMATNILFVSTFKYKILNELSLLCLRLDNLREEIPSLNIFKPYIKKTLLGKENSRVNHFDMVSDTHESQQASNNFCQIILYLKKVKFFTSQDLLEIVGIHDLLNNIFYYDRNSINPNVTRFGRARFGNSPDFSLSPVQIFHGTEINEVFPGVLNHVDKTITPDLQRYVEGVPGSLRNIIFNDDLSEFQRISSSPEFEFNQTILFPGFYNFNSLSLIEVAAVLDSPKIFRYLIENKVEVTWKAVFLAIGSCKEITDAIKNDMDKIIEKSQSSKESLFDIHNNYFNENGGFRKHLMTKGTVKTFLSAAIYKHDYEVMTSLIPRCNNFELGITCFNDSILNNNFRAFKEIHENLVNFYGKDSLIHAANTLIYKRFIDFFILLANIFGIDNIVNKRIINRGNRFQGQFQAINFLDNTLCENVALSNSIRLLKYLIKTIPKRIKNEASTIASTAAQDKNIDLIKYCFTKLYRQLNKELKIEKEGTNAEINEFTLSEIINIMHNLCSHDFNSDAPKIVYQNSKIPDDFIKYFIEVASGTDDLEFVSELIQKQLEIQPNSSFEIAFDKSVLSGHLEMCRLIAQHPISNIGSLDYLSTISKLIRTSESNEDTIEILRLYLTFLFNDDLRDAVIRILIESTYLQKIEIALFALTYNIAYGNAFVIAAKNGMIEVVRRMAEIENNSPIFINKKHPIFGSALTAACEAGKIEIVSFLLTIPGIKFNICDSFDRSPLDLSVKNLHYDIFTLLLRTNSTFLQTNNDKKSNGEDEDRDDEAEHERMRNFYTQEDINKSFYYYCCSNNQKPNQNNTNEMKNKENVINQSPISPSSPNLFNLLSPPGIGDMEFRSYEIQMFTSMLNCGVSNEELMNDFPNLFFNNHYGGVFFYNLPESELLVQKEDPRFFDIFFTKGIFQIDFDFYPSNETFLIAACRNKRVELIKRLLKEPDTNINAYDKHGNTALIYAVIQNSLEIVKLLCENDEIDINHQNFFKRNALSFAACGNFYEILIYLINNPDFDPNKSLVNAALAAAIINKHQEIVKILIQIDFNINAKVQFDEFCCTDPLVRSRVVQIPNVRASSIFQVTNNDRPKKQKEFANWSLLKIAVQKQDLESLNLISQHKQFRREESNADSALVYAAKSSNLEIFKAMLAISGRDVNFVYKKESLLCVTTYHNSENILKYIIKCDDFDPILSNTNTAFYTAIISQPYKIVKKISHIKGIEINGKCPKMPPHIVNRLNGQLLNGTLEGMTPLAIAAINSPDIVKLLLKHPDIDVNCRNSDGSTPIFNALQNPVSLDLLLKDKRIDINAQDNNGRTLLMTMAMHRQVQFAFTILARDDVDLTLVDHEGKNVINYSNPSMENVDIKTLTWKEVAEIMLQSVYNQPMLLDY